MQTAKERIAELEAEVKMLAAAGKAARVADAVAAGKLMITRSALDALRAVSPKEAMEKMTSQKYAVVDD
jgi:hypothetical protein